MRYMFLITIMLLVSSMGAFAKSPSQETLQVIYKVAKQYKIDAQDLVRIAYVESRFKETAKRVNTNGTIDYGMFQVNSVHWTTTCKQFNVFSLQGNAACAAKIIASIKRLHGHSDVHWLGRYHSKTPSKKMHYSQMLANVSF